MKVSQSVKFAGIIVAVIFAYFLARGIFTGGGATADEAPQSRFTVVTQTYGPQDWQAEIIVRGRTAAERKVIVRTETAGTVSDTPAAEGALVQEGDILCQLEINSRRAQRAEAQAALAKARLDYNAAVSLNKDGFRSETAVAGAKAALDLAIANEERAAIELEKTKIAAPFDGVFDHRDVDIGDYLKVGDACGTVIQQDPFLVTGAVAEKDVAKISIGDRGAARLSTGETIDGVVRFIASAADPATRTFTVELQVPNEDGALRDGVTADFTIFARQRMAHQLPHSSLTLGESGDIGVRTLSADDIVEFRKVTLLGETPAGVWVHGLDGAVEVIIRGQDFVSAGQKVDSVDADAADAKTGS